MSDVADREKEIELWRAEAVLLRRRAAAAAAADDEDEVVSATVASVEQLRVSPEPQSEDGAQSVSAELTEQLQHSINNATVKLSSDRLGYERRARPR